METATFADYWQAQPGAKAVKVDWEKTWRNWIRRAASSFRTAAQRKPLTNIQAAQQAAQALREGTMTTAHRSNQTTDLSTPGNALQVSARMSVFLAEELLPLMAGLWAASSNQLDGNARGVARAWGNLLRGFNAQQIREAVLLLGEEADWQFALRPAEVRATILQRSQASRATPAGCRVLMRVCEMEAEVRVFLLKHSVSADAVVKELQQVLAEKSCHGVTVTGRGGLRP